MRILFVTPYPPSRIRARSYGFLTHLRKAHEVTVIAQCMSARELADAEALRKEGYEVVTVAESKRDALLRTALALFSNLPLQVAFSRSRRFTEAILDLCSKRTFDVVHVEHLRGMASSEPLIHTHPVIWDPVDCITLLCKHTIVSGHSLQVRTVARLDHDRTQHYENKLVSQLQHIIITSERDRQNMIDLCRIERGDLTSSDEAIGKGIEVFPICIDLEYFHLMQEQRQPAQIVFSGKMSYHANVATALYLGREIMPLIWQTRPDATLAIVGSSPPREVQSLARDPRIEVTGFVDDIRTYIARARVVLCPMVYSVGVQFKVLEAMALGTPVVVAAQAAQSLKASDQRDLIVARSTQDYASAALSLMNDAELHATLVRGGRAYVEQYHDVRVLTRRLVEVYEQAVAQRTANDLSHREQFVSNYSR